MSGGNGSVICVSGCRMFLFADVWRVSGWGMFLFYRRGACFGLCSVFSLPVRRVLLSARWLLGCAMCPPLFSHGGGQVEEAAGGVGGDAGHFVGGERVDLCEAVDDVGDVGGFVAAAAVGDGGEVGGVGLEDDARERHDGGEGVGEGGLPEGDGAADAEHEAGEEAEEFGGLFGGAAETVEYAAGGEVGGEGEEGVDDFAVGGARVDDEGQAVTGGPSGLAVEDGYLFLPAGVVPVEVDAHFADGHVGVSGGVEQAFHAVEQGGGVGGEFGRVEAHHGVGEAGVFGAEAEHGTDAGFVDVGQEQGLGAGLAGAVDDGGTVGVELFGVDVGVGIDVHGDFF